MPKRLSLPEKPKMRTPRLFDRPDLTDRSTGSPAYKAWSKHLAMNGETRMRGVDSGWSVPEDWIYWEDGNWYAEGELVNAGWEKKDGGWIHKNEYLQHEKDLKKWERQVETINQQNADMDQADRYEDGRYSTAVNGVDGLQGNAKVKKTLLSAGAHNRMPDAAPELEPEEDPATEEQQTSTDGIKKRKYLIDPEEIRKNGSTKAKRLLGGKS